MTWEEILRFVPGGPPARPQGPRCKMSQPDGSPEQGPEEGPGPPHREGFSANWGFAILLPRAGLPASLGTAPQYQDLPGRKAVQEPHGEGDSMYRSVIESEQEGSERRRLWRWVEGILVAVVVVVGVTYLFGLITF